MNPKARHFIGFAVMGILLGVVSGSRAAEVVLRCSWDLPTGGGLLGMQRLDDFAVEASKFFDADHPLQLTLDVAARSVQLTDTDKVLLGFGSVAELPELIEVSFENPRIKGLIGRYSYLDAKIDRFDLSAFLTLKVREGDTGPWSTKWARKGRCEKMQF